MTTYPKELRAMIESREKAITSGGAKSWEEYREKCGVLQGLRLALNEYEKQREENHDDE